ncbi:MAG: PAS domain S-box protein [Sandaracinus sp.]|nr:PAS domain S-box protein [Sandaracinus sp.]MCB9617448.1 PAS domain S-box protein [Sandaracinus sp.]MCB9634796.1 PAS domain S-box protein [Sandaracinus sp.]
MEHGSDTSTGEAWFEAAADAGGVALFSCSLDGTLRGSVGLATMLGLPKQGPHSVEMLIEAADESQRAELRAALDSLVRGGEPSTLRHRFALRSTGRWLEVRARVEGTQVVGTFMDASSTRALEARSTVHADRLRAITNALPGLGLVLDEEGRYCALFAHDESLLAADRDTLIGKRMHDVLDPADADVFLGEIHACFREGRSRRVEYVLKVGGGTTYFEARVAPLEGGWAGRRAVVWVANDVTDRVRAEEALRASQAHLESILEHSEMLVYRVDHSGRILYSAGRGLAKLGFAPGELVGRDVRELSGPDDIAWIEQALAGQESHRESIYDGVYMQTHLIPLRDDGDELAGFVGVSFDVSELARARLERERFVRELEAKNTELERFNYTVSHDLKTPLVTIQGFVDLLARDLAEGEHGRVTRDLEHIAKASARMQALLDDLLELSRAGRIARPATISFAEVVSEALAQLEGRLRASGATVKVATDLPKVYADRTRLLQVVQNLIENAFKHSGVDAPIVDVGRREDGAFFVRDYGLGIAPRHQDRIFGLFERLDARAEGTGVGLALARRVIEAHGGRLWVESSGVAGEGATFCFSLPDGP